MSAISVSWLNVSWGAVYFETNYGLMQHSYIEIKNKLLRALDSEYNVVDMATVFEVVAVLEKTPITPEILESTRLGKVINECRRRTKNEVLAKRAKHLLRYWRNMMLTHSGDKSTSVVSPSASTILASTSSIPQQNGTNMRSPSTVKPDRTSASAISPALSTTSSNDRNNINLYDKVSPSSSLSPVRDTKVESVPKTHVANIRLRKNTSSSPSIGERPAKMLKVNGAMFPEVHDVGENSVDSDFSRVRDLKPVSEEKNDVPSSLMLTSASGVQQTVVTESVPEPDPPLPKKRSRKKGSKKKNLEDDIVKEKLVALSKTVRVKTTEELVAELKSRTEDRLLASTSDSQRCNESTAIITTSTNNSVKPSLSNKNTHSMCSSAVESDTSKAELQQHTNPEARIEYEISSILSKLPPLDTDNIGWESPLSSPKPSTPKSITDEDVERYVENQWEGVNGCVTQGVLKDNEDNGFREWHEMVSRRTTNDELIHILPFSIVD